MMGDHPPRTRVATSGGINSSATSIELPAGDVGRLFPQAGAFIEFDDDTDERALVTGRDLETNTITCLRAQEGTTAAAHSENVAILVNPSFSYTRVADAISDIVEGELWPFVWIPKETTISTFEADGHYSPSADDIEEIVHVYQLVAGEKFQVDFEWTSPEMADNTNFPNGILTLGYPADTSAFYVAYKAKVTLANATDKLLRLIGLGAAANLLEQSEMELVAPDQGKMMGVQESSRARIAQQMWQRFERRRWLEKVNLEQDDPAFA